MENQISKILITEKSFVNVAEIINYINMIHVLYNSNNQSFNKNFCLP